MFLKKSVIAESKVVAATSTSWLHKELWSSWAQQSDSRGVVVQFEEASADLEAHTLAVMGGPPWSNKIKATILSGDLAQLGPTVTSKQGAGQMNPFAGSLHLTLFERLIKLGFPNVHALKEQRRMHPDIAAFPNDDSYFGELRNGPATSKPLPETELIALADILGLKDAERRAEYVTLNYHKITKSTKRKQNKGTSSANLEHVNIVMEIVEKLMALYKGETSEHVLLIVPYRRQVRLSS